MSMQIRKLFVCLFLSFFVVPGTAWAAQTEPKRLYLYDFWGTMGGQRIGFSIATEDGPKYAMGNSKVKAAHYYHMKDYVDVSVTLDQQGGRHIWFKEYDEEGELKGTFDLTFVNEISKGGGLGQPFTPALVGAWLKADGTDKRPVYLSNVDVSVGDDAGGRCGLSGAEYKKFESRVRRFHQAVLREDAKALKKDFHFVIQPERLSVLKTIIEDDIPHDLICTSDGYMFNRGVVIFLLDGRLVDNTDMPDFQGLFQ